MPEGDTIRSVADRIRPVLVGEVPEVRTPHPRFARDRWPQRLAGRAVTAVATHGKHLFVHFEGDLALHSHLGMAGAWHVYPAGGAWRRPRRRAWLVLGARGQEAVQFDGPLLELMTAGRARFDQRLAALGPDILAPVFGAERFLARVRADDPTRAVGDALLDQTHVAGIGNIWKAEGCWEAGIDPWRRLGGLSDGELLAIVDGIRPRMQRSAAAGRPLEKPRVYGRAGRPCPRCGAIVRSRGQGDANRTTYWCPGCQL